MKLPFKQEKTFGVYLSKGEQRKVSSTVDYAFSNLVYPRVDFRKAYEYYETIGKVQNVVEYTVSKILKRDWYFESKNPQHVEQMNDWAKAYKIDKLHEKYVRDSMITGNFLISNKDWIQVQTTSLLGAHRDKYGIIEYYQQLNGDKLLPRDFIHEKYIEINREPWGLAHFHALMTGFTDIDDNPSTPTLEIYRQMQQDASKVYHKFASPRIIYGFNGISKAVVETQIGPTIDSMRPGDRIALSELPTMVSEQVDSKARFTDTIDLINSEVESGLQSSANRVINQPSAMADAREAGSMDDDRIYGMMERIRRFMDEKVIPAVLGVEDECHFKWGAEDSADLIFPPGLAVAIDKGVIDTNTAREILKSKGWKIPDVKQDSNQLDQLSDKIQEVKQEVQRLKEN